MAMAVPMAGATAIPPALDLLSLGDTETEARRRCFSLKAEDFFNLRRVKAKLGGLRPEPWTAQKASSVRERLPNDRGEFRRVAVRADMHIKSPSGLARSRWLWTPVTSTPLASNDRMTALISVSVRTRSPIIMAVCPVGSKATQPPSASPGLDCDPVEGDVKIAARKTVFVHGPSDSGFLADSGINLRPVGFSHSNGRGQ